MATQPNISVGPDWVNLVAVNPALAGEYVTLQSKAAYGELIFLVVGDEPAADSTDGLFLNRLDSAQVQGEAIWARCNVSADLGVTIA